MVCAVHHMIVGHDQEFVIRLSDDDSRTGGFALPCKGLAVEGLNLLRKVVVNGYDRGHHLVDDPGQFRIRCLRIRDHKSGLVLYACRVRIVGRPGLFRSGCVLLRCCCLFLSCCRLSALSFRLRSCLFLLCLGRRSLCGLLLLGFRFPVCLSRALFSGIRYCALRRLT